MRKAVFFRRAAGFAAVLAVSVFLTPARGATTQYGFHAPVVLPDSYDGSEPSLAISTDGIRYPSWQSPGEFARSSDGIHFTNIGMPDEAAVGDVTNAIDASGALFNGQICGDAQNVLHTCVYRSTDGGKTWPQKTQLADNHPGASDRPWIDVYPHRRAGSWNPDETTVYLEYHTFSPEELTYVTVSTDGGKTFSLPKMVSSDTNAIESSACNTVPGGVAVDDKSGAAYAVWLSGDDVTQNAATGCNYSQIGPFTKAWVSTSTDGGNTWTSHLAWHGDYDPTTNVGDNASKLFASIAVDAEGRPSILLAVRHHDDPLGLVTECESARASMTDCKEDPQPTDLLLASSPDQGATWTAPHKINKDTGSYFFPWIAAGSGGTIVAIYYKSTTLSPNDDASVWYAGSAQITGVNPVRSGDGAAYASEPVTREVLLDPAPVHKSGICTYGTFCAAVPNSNRNLADSLVISLDPSGGANAVWTNDAAVPPEPEGPQIPDPNAPDEQSKQIVQYACQNSGPSAFATQPALSACFAKAAVSPNPPGPEVLGGKQRRTLPGTGVGDDATNALAVLMLAGAAAIFTRRILRLV
ncbi:MAG: sialidase family protein [Actinomycetota bacterium]|nr:glycoside hydrolase [Actinomycetota bacterium]